MAAAKLERLMNLVAALLHTRTPVTAQELRERVGGYSDDDVAFHRQFSRDKEDLREMGVPIRVEPVAQSDPPVSGYRIDPDEYYLPDPGLEPDELAALHLATRLVTVGAGAEPVSLFKLGGLVDDPVPDVPASGTPLVTVPDDANLGLLFDASRRRRTVVFTHRDRERRLVPRVVGFRGGHWYVGGWDLDADAERVFRLDRIDGAVADGGPAPDVPGVRSTIEAMRPWEVGGRQATDVRIRVAAAAVPTVAAQVGDGRLESVGDDGSCETTIEVTNRDGFFAWVIGFGSDVEVLGPDAFRRDLVDRLAAAVGEPR